MSIFSIALSYKQGDICCKDLTLFSFANVCIYEVLLKWTCLVGTSVNLVCG